MNPIIVTTTFDDIEAAKQCAKILVENKLAACVQLSGPVRSIYRWNDKTESDTEYVLTIKSFSEIFDRISGTIKENHSYDVPEIVAVNISEAYQPYVEWMKNVVKS